METTNKAEARNQRIIQAVIAKMEKLCPGSVAIIGVGGSFFTGDIYEKSDLDLVIIINDDRGYALSSCFILDDIGFDIYCSKWDKLEHMAEYRDPYSDKLTDLEIVYALNKETEERYYQLQKALLEKLNSPLSDDDIDKAEAHLHRAEIEYIEVMLSDDIAECRFSSAQLLYHLEFSLYMINKKIVKRGVKRIPEEISGMAILPDNFLKFHNKLVCSETISEIKDSCTELLRIMRLCFKSFEKAPVKKEISAKDLVGTYEEIHSNWRNKMFHSIDINSPYLSFSTISSCQYFYNMMSDDFDTDNINIVKSFNPSDLAATAACFDSAMGEYLGLYKKLGVKVVEYATIEEFEKGYLL